MRGGFGAFFIAIYLGFTPMVFWVWFVLRRKKSHASSIILFFGFLLGIVSTLAAATIETRLLEFFPPFVQQCLNLACSLDRSRDVVGLLQLTLILIGPVEELLKFAGLWIIGRKRDNLAVNDYVRMGMAVGLGFAAMENAIYINRLLADPTVNFELVVVTLILRFVLSTSAHILYSGLIGYYYGLMKADVVPHRSRLIIGIILAIILHGAFDFFLFGGLPLYALLLVMFMAIALIFILLDRRNNEIRPKYDDILSEPLPSGTVIMQGSTVVQNFEPLNICPICLTPNQIHGNYCANCGAKLG